MAAFGNAVADFQVVAQSAYGYIIAIDMSANRIRTVTQVQLSDASLVFGTPVITGVPVETLLGYLGSSGAPSVAFCQTNQSLYVFLNLTDYPIADANRIGIFYDANYEPGDDVSDNLDIPVEAIGLLRAIALKNIKLNSSARVEFDVSQAIVREKKKLSLT